MSKNFPWVIEQFYNGHALLLKQLCASHDAMIKWRPYFIIIFSIFTQAFHACYGVFRCKGMGPKAQGHIHVYTWGLFRQQFFTQNSFSFHYIDVSNTGISIACSTVCSGADQKRKTSKLIVIGLCEGEFTCDRFPRHCCLHMCLFDCSSSRLSLEAGVHVNSRSVLEIFWNLQANMRFRYLENRGE